MTTVTSRITDQYLYFRVFLRYSNVVYMIEYIRTYKKLKFFTTNSSKFQVSIEFQAEHSTDHAIIQMLDQIYENFEENKYTLGVFIDLSQTFDTVDHKKFLSKLEIYGIK